MVYNIKKKDYDLIIRNLAKCLKIGDGLIFSGNTIHPVWMNPEADELSVNGTTTVRSFFPFELEEGVTMITVMNIDDVLAKLKSKAGMKKISILTDEHSIRINTDGDEIIIATTNRQYNGVSMAKSYSDFNTFVNIVDFDDNNDVVTKDLSMNELIRIRDSVPITLESEFGKIRISKNLLTLLGPMPKTKPVAALQVKWAVRQVILNEEMGLEDYVLSLHTYYKEIEAVHLYSVAPF